MPTNLFDLTGRVAVVMGGTSGIGRAIARGLAEAGADVVASGRREEKVHEVAAEIEKIGRKSLRHTVDAANRQSIDAFRDSVLAEFGRVDILVNSAGQTFRKPTVDITEPEWDNVIDVNLTGTLRSCQSFYEPLLASGHGRVVNIASLTSFVSFLEVTAYAASKAGVLGLDAQSRRRVGAERHPGECYCAGRLPHRPECSLPGRNGTWPRTVAADAHEAFRKYT